MKEEMKLGEGMKVAVDRAGVEAWAEKGTQAWRHLLKKYCM
jgi:hypothetical protein